MFTVRGCSYRSGSQEQLAQRNVMRIWTLFIISQPDANLCLASFQYGELFSLSSVLLFLQFDFDISVKERRASAHKCNAFLFTAHKSKWGWEGNKI